ncbi:MULTISPECIES: hypothetical protein [Streptomyces]|jgi:hypothetical protein|uniref:hypothetical protein n=1 Tax=Streptomyces TaxID=1883 RepID=UPI000A37DA2B|nr:MULTISPECIES: hypothetical protein [Streptomyces]NUK20542.1 hypothetical protein [Streptomyces lunaelactis]
MRNRSRFTAAVAVTAVLVVGATACENKFSEPFKDAPRSGVNNGEPMDVIRMSDGFSNVGAKCDGPNRVYVVYHSDKAYGSIAVVANDPRCAK